MLMSRNKEFRLFFECFFLPLCGFVEKYMGEDHESEDIAQEVFVKVYERWEEFEGRENAKAFLYTSARNLCLDRIKHKRAANNYISQYSREDAVEDAVFLKEVTRQETFRILHAAIDQLPSHTRQVIRLCLEGKNNTEVAEQLNVSVNTVKTLKKNAYASLRHLLSKEYLVLLSFLLGEMGK